MSPEPPTTKKAAAAAPTPTKKAVAAAAPGYRIGAVARLTGVSAHALRMWERRYGVLSAGRSTGGNRLYSEADVSRLRTIRQLVDHGLSIGQIAALDGDALERLLRERRGAGDAAATTEALADRFLSAIQAMDLESAAAELTRAQLALTPRAFVTELVPALLAELGDRWVSGELSMAQEHAATAIVRQQLGALLRVYEPPPGAPTIVCTTLEGELHELGALLVAVVASMNGWRACYLGPSLPVAECVFAAKKFSARALALSVVAPASRATVACVDELNRRLPRDVVLLLGGSGLGEHPWPLAGRVRRIRRLDDLEGYLRAER